MSHQTDLIRGHQTDLVRAEGPSVVRKGPRGATAVVVLDPAGHAKHGELPATWRPLAEDVEVVWCRLPAVPRTGLDADRLLRELAADGRRLVLVSYGGAALLTLSLAVSEPDHVRGVVLVNPPWPAVDLPALRLVVNHPDLILGQVDAETVTWAGPDPLPIGHPEVVGAVVRMLLTIGVGLDEPPPAPPGTESLGRHAWQALRARLDGLLESLGGGRDG
jgi:pimeloyl-ACP methyl ester carboxylesterase